jgi:prevent-host-death family protein
VQTGIQATRNILKTLDSRFHGNDKVGHPATFCESIRRDTIRIYNMRTVEFANAKLPLSEYARKVKKEPFIITKEGKPVAALVSLENTDMETVSLSNNPKFIRLIERSRSRQKTEGGISAEEIRSRLKNGQ